MYFGRLKSKVALFLVIVMIIMSFGLNVYAEENSIPVVPTNTENPTEVPVVAPTESSTVPTITLEEQQKLDEQKKIAEELAKKKAEEEALAKKKAEFQEKFAKDLETLVIPHITKYYKSHPKATIGVYVKDLTTGVEYGYNATKLDANGKDGYFKTASTCKLMAASVVYYLDNKGILDLDNTYKDKITGKPYKLSTLTTTMISKSVNDYFNTLLRGIGPADMNKYLQELGTKNSYVFSEIEPAVSASESLNIKRYGICRSPRTTPKDLGHLLDLMYTGEMIYGKENKDLFVKSMLANVYHSRIPDGIKRKSPVAHKTGTSDGVYNDAGVVYLEGRPYSVVVMSINAYSVEQTLRNINYDIYQYMVGLKGK